MKYLVIAFLMSFSIAGFSQNENKCGQLPFAVVDQKAELKTDLKKDIEDTNPASFADKNEHKANFKVVVACNGSVQSVMYQSGNFNEQEQVWMKVQLKNSSWKPAVLSEKEVSSTVIVTVVFQNDKAEITLK
ncbi:MAG: hypothetical protein R2780_12295 [Crocinitomicaceae bacterium]|nr:hypothetical protein [Crocinitomicaceae bacterium]